MVKNYNLNVTEVRDSDFKNSSPGIFNFTVGILVSFNNFDELKHLNGCFDHKTKITGDNQVKFRIG